MIISDNYISCCILTMRLKAAMLSMALDQWGNLNARKLPNSVWIYPALPSVVCANRRTAFKLLSSNSSDYPPLVTILFGTYISRLRICTHLWIFTQLPLMLIINLWNPFKFIFIFISLLTNHYLKIEILSFNHCEYW